MILMRSRSQRRWKSSMAPARPAAVWSTWGAWRQKATGGRSTGRRFVAASTRSRLVMVGMAGSLPSAGASKWPPLSPRQLSLRAPVSSRCAPPSALAARPRRLSVRAPVGSRCARSVSSRCARSGGRAALQEAVTNEAGEGGDDARLPEALVGFPAQDVERVVDGHRFLVRARGVKGVEDVRHRHDARAERDGLADEVVRVAGTVPALVMVADEGPHVVQRVESPHEVGARLRM